jgi:hypothetical protein
VGCQFLVILTPSDYSKRDLVNRVFAIQLGIGREFCTSCVSRNHQFNVL